ncbi:MAG: DHH family phosphoesterase [Candidatus Eisenbacteria bacterium]
MAKTHWKIRPVDSASAKRLEYGLGISNITAKVLVARGISSETDARKFLNPSMSDLQDPMLLPDIEPALERLTAAVSNDEAIMVLGHDDVDGITATTIIFGPLKEMGADVSYYIPDSPTEGIGLSNEIVDRFKKSGVSLIVTVDCCVSCKNEIAYAKSLGIDTIVTDHHEPPDELPPAVAVVNAKRHDTAYTFRELAGCGVAYRFMEAFAQHYRKIGNPPSLEGLLGMAALGSFADRVPLLGENRILVHNGTKEIMTRRLVPFVTLRSHIWLDDHPTMTEVLGKMVPIVGGSRSHEGGNLGCELLLSGEGDDAEDILTSLVTECERKRERARRTLDKVVSHMSGMDVSSGKVIVLLEERLPSKAVGYCASRLTDNLHKPVVIISMRGDTGVGEARAPKGVDLVDALAANKQYFMGYGGHKQAAGFSIERSKVEAFRKSFIDYLEAKIDPSVIEREIVIDDRLKPDDVNMDNLKSLLCLEPFGQEHGRPIFLLESLHKSMLKTIDGTLKLGEVNLSGNDFASQVDWEAGEKLNLVVSFLGEGGVRVLEVMDWKKAK